MLVDLHVHLRGTLTHETYLLLCERNGVHPVAASQSHFNCGNFASFLQAYERTAQAIKTPHDIETVALSYLTRCAALGGRYVEFMLSPPEEGGGSASFSEQIKGLESAAAIALEEHHIHCRLIATAVRHRGPEAALQAAKIASGANSSLLVGFGLTGDETRFATADFVDAFRIANSAGLRRTAHAGEHLPAGSILEAVESLDLDRVGHAFTSVQDDQVLRQLSAAGVALEICMSSNVVLGLCSYATHPIKAIADAGCTIVLGTDDPGFFNTDLRREYDHALRSAPSLSVKRISAAAIGAAFCDAALRTELSELLASSRRYRAG